MKKLTTKQLTVLRAAKEGTLWAGKATFRSTRLYNFTIDFEAGYFNAQTDRLIEMGLVTISSKAENGQWGPRHVWITAEGQKALKN